MKNIWTIVCKNSVVDQATNTITLIESVEEIQINYTGNEIDRKVLKIIPIDFCVVSLWYDEHIKTERSLDLQIEIVAPNKNIVQTYKYKGVFEKNKNRLRLITKINGLGFVNDGEYLVRLKYKINKESKEWLVANENPVDIKAVKSE